MHTAPCITQPVTSIKKQNRLFKAKNIPDVRYHSEQMCLFPIRQRSLSRRRDEGSLLECLTVSCTPNVQPKCIVSFFQNENRKLETLSAAEMRYHVSISNSADATWWKTICGSLLTVCRYVTNCVCRVNY